MKIIDTMTKEDVLKECTVEGLVVKLPASQLDRKLYQEVAKSIELIGGKWKGGKVMGFVFNESPSELLSQIQDGEKRNLKKEFQFFATPDDLADELVALADLEFDHRILEPSAGQGAIVKAINRKYPLMGVWCYELMPINESMLRKIPTVRLLGSDFLEYKPVTFLYDRIIANPPFSKNQDINHIRHMYSWLADGGRMVTMASKHWQFCDNKKEKEFRDWIDLLKTFGKCEVMEVDSGRFKSSGTTIATVILIIDK